VLGVVALIVVQEGAIMAQQSRSQVHAPEFPPGLQWLNTDTPLTIAGLRGKVVLLDFWTYCCINCMHVIPDLKALEKKYPQELVVIGVHSAKFSNEREADNIRQAVLRYGIEHPVVNDHEFRVWQSYGVRAWPTLALIDPSGYVIGGVSGEGNFELLDRVIGEVVQAARAKGALDETPPQWALEKAKSPPAPWPFRVRSWPMRPRAGCSSPIPTIIASSSQICRGRCSMSPALARKAGPMARLPRPPLVIPKA